MPRAVLAIILTLSLTSAIPTQAENEEAALETTVYRLRADALEKLEATAAAAIGAGEIDDESSSTPKELLARLGVNYPEGSSLFYNEPTSQLIVRNTPTQNALIQNLVQSADEEAAAHRTQIRITTSSVTMPTDSVRAVFSMASAHWPAAMELEEPTEILRRRWWELTYETVEKQPEPPALFSAVGIYSERTYENLIDRFGMHKDITIHHHGEVITRDTRATTIDFPLNDDRETISFHINPCIGDDGDTLELTITPDVEGAEGIDYWGWGGDTTAIAGPANSETTTYLFITAQQFGSIPEEVKAEMNRIVFPKIRFRQASLEGVIDVLRMKISELEDPKATKRGIHLMIRPFPNPAEISIDLNEASLSYTLERIAELVDGELSTSGYQIVLAPRRDDPQLIEEPPE